MVIIVVIVVGLTVVIVVVIVPFSIIAFWINIASVMLAVGFTLKTMPIPQTLIC